MDPSNDSLIVFDFEKVKLPTLPASVSFQILVSIKNIIVQLWCIIDEGASTYVLIASDGKQLGSPNLSPSTISICACDSHPPHPLCLYRKYPITIVDKIILIGIEAIDAPLDYIILLSHSLSFHPLYITRCAFLTIERPSILIS